MRKTIVGTLGIGLISLALAGANCGPGPIGADAAFADGGGGFDGGGGHDAAGGSDAATGQDTAGQPPGHTDNQSGVWHRPGKEDPLTNCVACHGSDLRGGTGPSCYSCHNANDHSNNRNGVMHRSGTTASCNPCHGPSNTGGLGPACSTCH